VVIALPSERPIGGYYMMIIIKTMVVIASEAKQSMPQSAEIWIASSRNLSSGAHSRDPLAPRNDDVRLT
jgi:hypothetical protein